jgi:Kef-type K+ transport system membrane component KefB
MTPRGEVQLIFAAMGQTLGVMSPEVFSAIVIVVIATTIFSPILIGMALREPASKDLSPAR